MTYVLNSTASVAPAKSINTAGLSFWQRLYVAMIESVTTAGRCVSFSSW